MERRPQRGTNRGRSGMVARSTDVHKTNASLGAEHHDGVGMVMVMIIQRAMASTLFAIYCAGTESVSQTPFRERKNV